MSAGGQQPSMRDGERIMAAVTPSAEPAVGPALDAALSKVRCKTIRRRLVVGVGQPFYMKLNQWGLLLYHAFDTHPYLVGTALLGKQWRDVDVRLILEDERFDAMFPTRNGPGRQKFETDGLWQAVCTAFAVWGREFTGLPIDFQIQRQTDANARYHGPRNALGIIFHQDASAALAALDSAGGELP